MSFSRSVLESHVLALAVAQLVEPLQQRLHRRGVLPGSEGEEADSVHLPRRLRLGGERRGEEAAGDHAKEGSSLHYPMTRISPQQHGPPQGVRSRAEHSISGGASKRRATGGIALSRGGRVALGHAFPPSCC